MKRGDSLHEFHEVEGGRPFMETMDPKRAATVVWLASQGLTTGQIVKMVKIDKLTVLRLKVRNGDLMEDIRKKMSIEYSRAAVAYTDLMMEKAERLMDAPEKLDDISPDKLAMTVGIMTDKAAQCAGMASTVIEHRGGASISDAQKIILEAQARIADRMKANVIEAEVVS